MNGCINCKHCKIFHAPNGYTMFLCKKYYKINNITGYKHYEHCEDIRRLYNNCSLFERKVSILERIINWF